MSSHETVVCCSHGRQQCIVGRFYEVFESNYRTDKSTTPFTVSSIDSEYTQYSSKDAISEKQEKPRGAAAQAYIGARTRKDAEKNVLNSTEFMLYHLLPKTHFELDDLEPSLPLYIMYRNTLKQAKHYPIKSIDIDERRFLSVVSENEGKPLLFESLDALVKYYKTYVQIYPNGGKDGVVDVF